MTLYVLLLTAFKALLARYSGRTEVVVGTDMAVRDSRDPAFDGGPFCKPSCPPHRSWLFAGFDTALKQVRDVVLDAMVNRTTPCSGSWRGLLRRPRSPSRLFRILFGFQTLSTSVHGWSAVPIKRLETVWNTAKHDLSLMVRQEDGELSALLEYRDDLFDEATARRILAQFQMVLEQGVRDPTLGIHDFSLLSRSVEHRLASVFNEAFELV